MEIITSPSNKTVKLLSALKQKKYRDERGEFFIEGYKNVLDTAEARPESVRFIVLSEKCREEYVPKFTAFDIVVLSDRLFDRVAETETSQGVISINAQKPYGFPQSDRCILLDRVRDPGNVGTIIRTAVAAGYDVVLNNCADVYSPKVIRSSMSAVLKCRLGADISAAELKAGGYELIAADMGGENVFAASLPKGKYCVIIGNEAEGISAEMRAAADRTLAVPQRGIESLNASVAAGVMMFVLTAGNTLPNN